MQRTYPLQHEWIDGVLDKLSAGICIVDGNRHIVWINEALRHYLDLGNGDLIGKSKKQMLRLAQMRSLKRPDDPLAAQWIDNSRDTRDAVEYHVPGHKRRQERWLRMNRCRIEIGKFRGSHVEHYADITAQKQSEHAVRSTLGEIIKAIGLTIQYKDPYTALHQTRVADLAKLLAEEMQLPRQRIDAIYTAAAVHDVGKIGVPGEILSKPTGLSENEFNLIKEHPQIGYNILKDLEFPWDISGIVLQHHERINGSGYPRGLVGDEIKIEARVLAVADVVESMAANRPYRPSLGVDRALAEITNGRDRLFCPEAVDACLRLFNEKDYEFC